MWKIEALGVLFYLLIVLCSATTSSAAGTQSFAGSKTCAECHSPETAAWSRSDHAWAIREPSPENVLGDFNNAAFSSNGVTSHFSTNGQDYFVETDGPDGKITKFKIAYTVGVRPLQQYLVETEKGRLQALDIAWDIERKSWYHLYPGTEVGAGNGLHWTGTYKNWQARCAECHQTGFKKNYEPLTSTYSSHWADLTVSCESCHGAASAHVAWARDPVRSRSAEPAGTFLKLGVGQLVNELAICGPCHARREPLSADSAPAGSIFGDYYNLALLTSGRYFADGQQRDEVFILGSFLQSKMKAKGVTCSNCHEPHSAKLVANGNAVCTQCHNASGRDAFPSLNKANYDTPAHHHHQQTSEAAQCVSCHMPGRTYMGIDKRRDHFFRRPDPVQSKAADSPDVCMTCHYGKTAEWAAQQIATWFPNSNLAWQDRSAFIAFEKGDTSPTVLTALADYALNLDHPDIVRATALDDLLGWADDAQFGRLQSLLADSNATVRTAMAHLSRGLEAVRRDQFLRPLLSDPVRAVRQAAATELIANDPNTMTADERASFAGALGEYLNTRSATADTPESQMAIGGFALTRRNWSAAEAAFTEAAAMDPQLEAAWLMLSRLKAAQGDETASAGYLVRGLDKLPRSIGLLLERAGSEAGRGHDGKAIDWYRRVIAIDENQKDALIGVAASALRMGNSGLALDSSAKILVLEPGNTDALVVSAIASYSTGDIVHAREFARRAREFNPLIQLPDELNQMLQGG